MKYLKLYLLFIFVILFSPKVFASTDVNINSTIKFPYNGSNGTYQGLEVYNSGGAFTYSIGTRYNGKLSTINFYSSYSFEPNTTYTITLNMATNDWRNNFMGPQVFRANSDGSIPSTASNWAGNSSITFVSRQKIKFNFTTDSTLGPLTKFTIYSTNANEIPFTGESNWKLSSVILTIPTGSSGGGSSGGGSSDSTNQDIINNNNTNTQDIINNNNSNTDRIVDSIKDTFNNCQQVDKTITIADVDSSLTDKYLTGNGSIGVASGYNISNYIDILPNAQYTLTTNDNNPNNVFFCWYDISKTPLHCTKYEQKTSWYFHTGTTAKYIRFTIRSASNSPSYQLHLVSDEVCTNKLDETNSAINDTNNYLKDDSDPTIDSSALNNVFGTVHFSDPLSYLLTLPTQLINKIVSISDTCSAIDLGTLYGVHLTLPCINLQSYLGNDLWNILDVILSVGLLSVILKNFYDTISNLLTLGGEKEAKEKFSMPTPMDFLAMILGGDNR